MTTGREILEGLNPAQREAVETIEGALLIIAGPGSGKTRVITHRIAYLVRVCGVSPYRILAVTFTNKAAREMNGRLQRLVGTRAEQLTVGTFHAFCASLLRRNGKNVGVEPNFTIYDSDDQMDLLKIAMEEAEVDPRQFNRRAIQGVISRAKSLLVDAHGLALNHESYFEERAARVYERYEELLSRNNAVDFDDLLMKAVLLLRNHPEVLKRHQQRYLHILIDEFQDTNVAQYALSSLLAGENSNICVVGDPDQSIYSWRNADIGNILSFQRDYPDAKTFTLEENYRSTSTIVEAAKQLISSNRRRLDKDLWTSKGEGKSIVVHEAYTEEEEARFVLAEVERLCKEEDFSPGGCAVMYRVNAQSRALEEACLRYGTKYRLVGGVRFYQRREVKDVMCYLRLIANPDDEISLTRVINVPPRGIGQRTIQDFLHWARGLSGSPTLLASIEALTDAGKSDGLPPHHLSPRAVKALGDFAGLIKGLTEESLRMNVTELIAAVQERTGYWQYIERQDRPEERMENLLELRVAAREFDEMEPPEGLATLLERLALVADVDLYEESPDSLTLITLHQAKGLEFPVVFIVGMEEGLLPHSRSMDSPDELEEERRLCYVGITRSQERLYLLRAFRRGLMGGSSPTIASRYLGEIPSHLIASPHRVAPTISLGAWGPQEEEKVIPVPPALATGDKVEHSTFGEGVVVSCVPSGQDYEVTVAFKDGVGVKRLLVSYAPLAKLG